MIPTDTGSPDLERQAARSFEARFGSLPDAVAFAPGRVNLLGEHTDYNGGFVLPMALALGTAVSLGRGGPPGTIRIASESFDTEETRDIDEAATGAWSDYILGSLRAAAAPLVAETGLRILVASDLPVGAGLSSSAAVEVCTLRAAGSLTGAQLDPVAVALRARSVENDFVGMPCGIMDQFAVSVGTPGAALFLDTRTLTHRRVPLPGGHRFLVIHSGVSHRLTDDGYSTRVAECNAACEALGVDMLSDLGPNDLERVASLRPPLNRRARHVVTENQRVLDAADALGAGQAGRFAELMIASHRSQRDDYDVSVPEVDALVEGVLAAGGEGARLTGGGFGGSIVVLVKEGRVQGLRETISADYPTARVLAEM